VLAIPAVLFVGLLPAEARTRGAILVDADDGRVMSAVNADIPNHPASLTKIMTLYLLFDALEKGRVHLHDPMAVSAHAAGQQATKLGLNPGQTITVEQAILGMVTLSANDAAVVVGEFLGGSESGFAVIMTNKARELGMRQTVFRNASGLPIAGQWSTPRDMAMLARALIKNHAAEYHYFSTREFDFAGRAIPTHNHLLGNYEGADGIKTGYIASSGFNLVASAKRNGHRLIGVVFGGNTIRDRDRLMVALLDAGFAREGNAPAIATAKLDTLPEPEDEANAPAPQTEAEAEDPQVSAVMQAMASAQPPAVAAAPATGTTATKTAAITATAKTTAADLQPEGAGDADDLPWGIRLGSFGARAKAAHLADTVAARLGDLVSAGHAEVASTKSRHAVHYEALVVGLAESDAQRACRTLHHHRVPCHVIRTENIHVASR
jgi:D-alanyl-D-alanine carboxypeptidase